MKKLLVLFLALVVCMSALVACELPFDLPFFGEEEPAEVTYKLDSAVKYVKNLYNSEQVKPEGSDIASATKFDDFERVSAVNIAGVMYDVVWSADVTDESKVKIVQGQGTTPTVIDVNGKSPEEYSFTLTATVKAGDGTSDSSLKFNFVIPAYNVISFEEYMAAKENDQVTVEGIVVAINSKAAGNSRNHLFLADASGKGGYYSYQMDQDPVADLGIEIGMTVAVSGPVTPYSGMQEIKGGTARIISREKTDVAPLDITEAFKSGADLKNYVGLPVIIKGVEIGTQALGGTSEYLYFSLNGKEGYVRTYITDFPTTLSIVIAEDGTKSSPDKDAIDAAHAAKFGWTANASGILVLYSGNPYLIPTSVDCFEYIEYVQKTAEEKIASELELLTFSNTFTSDAVVDLLLAGQNYSDVVISWKSDNDAIVIADGKATIVVPENGATVKLTATLTCGEQTATKEFEVKVSQSITSIPAIIEIAKGLEDKGPTTEGKYLVAGIVTEIKNATYGNLYITDAQGNKLYIYGLYDANDVRYDKMEVKPVVGDYIVVLSVVGHYNEPQLKNAHITTHVAATSIADANTIGGALENKGPATDNKYLVSGVVTEIKNATYGNLYIKDEAGKSIYLYGLYSEDGSVRYDAMSVKPAVGDTITVYGVLSNYNGVQVKNGWLFAHTVAAPSTPEGGESGEVTPPAVDPNSIEAYAAANGWVNSTLYDTITLANGAKVTCSGTPVGDYGQNTGKFYTNDSGDDTWRIYQNENPSVVITAAEGKTIASVKITYSIKNDGTLTLNGENIASGTVVNVNASSVTFSVGNTGTKTNGQAQITAIEVVYA